MKLNSLISLFFLVFALTTSISSQSAAGSEDYLSWSASQAESIGKSTRNNGKVGNGFFDTRILSQDKAINYKLRATLMTPEVIRATARFEQLRNRLSDDETRKLVKEAESAGDLVVMIELDPNEGSGVIPLDWRVFLQPKGSKSTDGAIQGKKSPEFRNIKALNGVARRDYNYDVFWVSFPLIDGKKNSTIPSDNTQIELVVGIYGKEGRVSWTVPDSVVSKMLKIKEKK